jgi:hypothetical protein
MALGLLGFRLLAWWAMRRPLRGEHEPWSDSPMSQQNLVEAEVRLL